ncbi:hypothetical protein [Sphingomonas daechungensis]|uniref:hypothetical protein n=1 Tax=Sphingomonas daechungensis TaxID=1176646 RepID=UPI003784DCB9
MTDKPLTAEVLADALDQFWGAAIGEFRRSGGDPVACVCVGLQAVANRLREHAADPADAPEQKGEPR